MTNERSSTTTDTLDINNEVLIEAKKTSDQAYSSSNNFVTVTWDSEVVDVTNDFDLANDNFSPPEDGSYIISAHLQLSAVSDQDDVRLLLRDTTASSNVYVSRTSTSGTGTNPLQITVCVDLSASQTYEIQFRNVDSDCTIDAGSQDDASWLGVIRAEEN